MKTYLLRFLLVLALVASTGCRTVAPRTSALDRVHDAYRAEFLQLQLPAPADGATPGRGTNAPFAATIQAMRDFRVIYGEESAEAAHLKVLEGMIYLQCGRPGMARLLQPEVAAAAPRLRSATGILVRDGLFAENFPALILGWGEVADAFDKKPDGSDNDATFPESAKLAEAAQSISVNLVANAAKGRLATPETDEGAVYLATTSAIFYDWAYQLRRGTDANEAERLRRQWFPAARELIGRFLTPSEQTASSDLQAGEPVPSGRFRYLQWYEWLGKNAH